MIIVQVDIYQFSNINFVRLIPISLVVKIKITWSNFKTNSHSGIVIFLHLSGPLFYETTKKICIHNTYHITNASGFNGHFTYTFTLPHGVYLVIKVKRQTQMLRKNLLAHWLLSTSSEKVNFLSKILEKNTTTIIKITLKNCVHYVFPNKTKKNTSQTFWVTLHTFVG